VLDRERRRRQGLGFGVGWGEVVPSWGAQRAAVAQAGRGSGAEWD